MHLNAAVAGAIRWDAWHGDRSEVGKTVERSLGPKKWHGRLPFFARIVAPDQVRIDGASQAVVDREIRYARTALLDYWAFVLYEEGSPMNLGLQYYLSSTRKNGLRFCLILEQERWAAGRLERVAELMARPEYQTVAGGRPLLYVLAARPESEAWGWLDRLRALKPYVVIQDSRAERAGAAREKAHADAIGAYAYQRGGQNAPYAQLAQETERFWEACRSTGSTVVPIVMTGRDRRPRVERPVFWEPRQRPGDGIERFYRAPSPAELSRHVRNAVAWVAAHPDAAPANAILIYAWNENDEGGWLVPTSKKAIGA